MIHVLDFDDKIIDFISDKDIYITQASISRNKAEDTDTFDFVIDSDRAYNMRERYRIIVPDRNNKYREYIIVNVSDDINDETTVQCNPSYVEDIATARPYAPGGFDKFTTTQALDDILKDTGWERSEETEYGGVRSSKWTSYQTRYEVLLQMRTTYKMELDFYIELGSNTVEHRFVSLKEKNAIFKGKEIAYGKDLLTMTRTVDISEIKTALLAIGPEDDKGNRKELVVTDDDAQEQFGLEKRYIWGIYEPESDDSNMSEKRLRTLATTKLNKDKKASISYEISSADLTHLYDHEQVNLGDKVRVKDTEFNPPLYIDAEVVSEEYDLISKQSTFTFGNIKEYKASELRKDLYDRIADIRQKMNDNISNVNTIVQDVVAGQLEYFERKIIKSPTPPENPVNDMMWYDTSNPEVAVLRRYWNGEWVEQTADDVEKIGGITREKALYSELTNTFINLTIQHSKLQSDVYEVISNEYLVDDDLKAKVNAEFNKTATTYNNIKTNIDSMKPETATIGKLVDTQALFLRYREQLQELYKAVENAKRAIDKRFKLLQSQYTDEKFNDAMEKIASTLPNGQWDSENKQLIGEIPSRQELNTLQTTLKQYFANEIETLNDAIGKETDSKINVAKDEINANVSSIEKKIDGLEVGGTNLLESSETIKKTLEDTIRGYNQFWRVDITHVHDKLKLDDVITISFDVEMERGDYLQVYDTNYNYDFSFRNHKFFNIGNKKQRLSFTKPLIGATKTSTTWYLDFYNGNNGDKFTIENIKIEKGNVATAWSKAPEDIENQIRVAQQDATEGAKAYADAQDNLKQLELKAYADGVIDETEQRALNNAIEKMNEAKNYAEQKALEAQNLAIADADKKLNPITTRVITAESNIQALEDGLRLTATRQEVKQTLDKELQPIKNDVNIQKARLQVLPLQISSKVSKSDYETDKNNIVKQLKDAETERVQLSESIQDKVTLKQFNDFKEGTPNLLTNIGFENGTFVLATGEPVGASTTRVRTTDFIDVTNGEYTMKVHNMPQDTVYQVNFYQYDADSNFIKASSFYSLNDKHTYTFDDNVHKVKLLFKNSQNTDITPEEIVNATIKFEKGDVATDYYINPTENERRLNILNTLIQQNGKDIQLKTSSEEFNENRKTLSRVIADLTINTTTGLSLTYDENGAISSHTVDKNGVKIRGDKVDIAVNKEFQVLAGNVDDKVGKNEVINRLNLSPEGLDINVNKIGIHGGDKSTRYVDIRNNSIELGGVIATDWRGNRNTDPIYTRLKDGHLRFRNNTKDASLYFSYYGISTYMDGEGEHGGSSGTIAWWDPSYSPSGANGITINSYGGVAALTSGLNRTMVQSRASVNLESMRSSIFIRPQKSEVGNSTFAFTTTTGATSNSDVKGYLMFGDLTNEDNWKYYSGLRFYKGKSYIEVVDGTFSAGGNTVLDTGNIMTNSIYKRNGSTTTYWNGTSSGTINDGALPIDNQLVATSMVTNRGDKTMYLGTRSRGEVKVTDEHGYNSGKGITYRNIRAADYLPGSDEKYKKNITPWNYDALNVLVNETQVYQYKLKDKDDEKDASSDNSAGLYRRGLVIGDDYDIPTEFIHGDGVSLYEISSWQIRAIQQLNEKLEQQNELIKKLEEQLNEQ